MSCESPKKISSLIAEKNKGGNESLPTIDEESSLSALAAMAKA